MRQLLNRLRRGVATKPKGGISTYEDPTLGTITINRSARSRRISLAVKPSGEVRLTIPVTADQRMAIEFMHSRREWIVAARQRMAAVERPHFSDSQIEELRRRAKEYLPKRCATLAAHYNLHYNRITIRDTRSRWGSCSATNNLSFSLHLMTLPEHLIDFVILHELAHTIHHNHSAQFHQLLNSMLGGREGELNREIRKFRIAAR